MMFYIPPNMWRDALRWFEVVQALMLICIVVGIIVYYLLSVPSGERRLLKWHVVMVSISYLGAITFMFVELLGRMSTPLTWRGWFATPVFVVGLAAMITLVSHLSISRKRGFRNNNNNNLSGNRSIEEWEDRLRIIFAEELGKVLRNKRIRN